ncbi:MAG: DUF599 family protein [Octadecabacter sp.]
MKPITSLGGLVALIGNIDPLQNVIMRIGHLPPAMEPQTKRVLVLVLLGNAFLKFVWANRVFGDCLVMWAQPPTIPMTQVPSPWIADAVGRLAGGLVIGLLVWTREFTSLPREIIMNDVPDTKA